MLPITSSRAHFKVELSKKITSLSILRHPGMPLNLSVHMRTSTCIPITILQGFEILYALIATQFLKGALSYTSSHVHSKVWKVWMLMKRQYCYCRGFYQFPGLHTVFQSPYIWEVGHAQHAGCSIAKCAPHHPSPPLPSPAVLQGTRENLDFANSSSVAKFSH